MDEDILRMNPAAEYFIEEGCYINELSNVEADPAVSIARVRVPPGVSTRWHRLKGTAERYVMLSGAGRVEVGSMDAQDIRPGDVVRIPPGCRQRITNTGDADLIFLAVCTPRFRPESYRDAASLPDGEHPAQAGPQSGKGALPS